MTTDATAGSKRCKQCGRQLDENNFREYVPRGAGKRQDSVGRHTLCFECELFNSRISALWRRVCAMEDKKPTAMQQNRLDNAAMAYKLLHKNGLEPVGAYARHVLGTGQYVAKGRVGGRVAAEENYIACVTSCVEGATTTPPEITEAQRLLMAEYSALLSAELTDTPDHYNALHEALQARCPKDDTGMRVAEPLRQYDIELTNRLMAYEDEYWAKIKDNKGGLNKV